MILRRQGQWLFVFLQLIAFTTATIKGDKEVPEPYPLPPKPLPTNLIPSITKVSDLLNEGGQKIGEKVAGLTGSEAVKNVPDTFGSSSKSATSIMDEKPIKAYHDDDDNPTTSKEGLISPMHSFFLAFLMIVFSEIGDKTFLIAALMAMKHSRLVVFTAAFSSLIVMSVLSALLGHAVPTLIPKRVTNWLAALLFLIFGVKMLLEGLKMEKGTESVQEEMREVEQELVEKEAEARGRSASNASMLEEGRANRSGKNPLRRSTSSPAMSDSDSETFSGHQRKGDKSTLKTITDGIQNLAGLLLSPAWVQTFIMTFLGEWGDRSQIATIAMAAGQDYWFVTIGAIFGHSLCTAGAVIGGKLLASKISVRNVTLGGAVSFLAFGVIYGFEAVYT